MEYSELRRRLLQDNNLDQPEETEAEEEDERGEYESSTAVVGLEWWKTVVILGVIGACFAVAYPLMFHPMILFALGLNKKSEAPDPSDGPSPPIRGRDPRMGNGRIGGTTGPGAAGGGGAFSKSVVTYSLPLFAFGSIAFLLYTLGKSKMGEGRGQGRAERAVAGAGKVKALESRLQQTEAAMERILGQLEHLSDTVPNPQTKTETDPALNDSLARIAAALNHPAKKQKDKEGKYLRNLEQALTEFSTFTEKYIQKRVEEAPATQNEMSDTKDFVQGLMSNEGELKE